MSGARERERENQWVHLGAWWRRRDWTVTSRVSSLLVTPDDSNHAPRHSHCFTSTTHLQCVACWVTYRTVHRNGVFHVVGSSWCSVCTTGVHAWASDSSTAPVRFFFAAVPRRINYSRASNIYLRVSLMLFCSAPLPPPLLCPSVALLQASYTKSFTIVVSLLSNTGHYWELVYWLPATGPVRFLVKVWSMGNWWGCLVVLTAVTLGWCSLSSELLIVTDRYRHCQRFVYEMSQCTRAACRDTSGLHLYSLLYSNSR